MRELALIAFKIHHSSFHAALPQYYPLIYSSNSSWLYFFSLTSTVLFYMVPINVGKENAATAYKDKEQEAWFANFRHNDWRGESKQKSKRDLRTKHKART